MANLPRQRIASNGMVSIRWFRGSLVCHRCNLLALDACDHHDVHAHDRWRSLAWPWSPNDVPYLDEMAVVNAPILSTDGIAIPEYATSNATPPTVSFDKALEYNGRLPWSVVKIDLVTKSIKHWSEVTSLSIGVALPSTSDGNPIDNHIFALNTLSSCFR